MVPEFVERIRGSRWLSALPTGSKWQSTLSTGSKWQSALPTGSRWQSALPTRKTADLGRSNLWRPMVVDRMRGSMCVQAQPAQPEREDRGW